MEKEAATEIWCFLKKLDCGQRFFKKIRLWTSPKKKIVSVNFTHALFSLLDFLTLEDETDGLS